MSESSTSPEAAPPIPALPPPSPAPPPRPLKNPWIALVLSAFFPGVGQVYNGQLAKAIVFFLAFVGAIYGTVDVSPFPFAFMIPFVYLFNLVDAYRGALLGGDQSELVEDVAESPAWGIALVVLGGLLLLHNLGWLNLHSLARFWPLVLIGLGLLFLRGAMQRRKSQ